MKKMQWGGVILCFPEQTYHRIILYHQVAHYTEIISFSAVSSFDPPPVSSDIDFLVDGDIRVWSFW